MFGGNKPNFNENVLARKIHSGMISVLFFWIKETSYVLEHMYCSARNFAEKYCINEPIIYSNIFIVFNKQSLFS